MTTNSMIIKGKLEILNEGIFNTLSNYLREPKIDFQLVSVKLDPGQELNPLKLLSCWVFFFSYFVSGFGVFLF